jgi:hypothetical protein
MTSHELGQLLLDGPDVPVVSGLDRSGYGEPVDHINIVEAKITDGDENDLTQMVVDLVLSENSTHET